MAYENWTGWTEYDPDGDFTVAANQIDIDTIARNSEGQVWKNHGTDYFDDFTHYIDFNHTARNTKSAIAIWTMNNVNGPSAGDGVGLSLAAYSPDGANSYAWLEDLGEATSDFCVINLSNRYYIKIVRSGTSITAYFYNNAAHTDLWNDIGPISCHTRPYSTIAIGATGNAESSATMTGVVYNLDIGASPDPITWVAHTHKTLVFA